MEKETYKAAKEILERFDPDSKKLQVFIYVFTGKIYIIRNSNNFS